MKQKHLTAIDRKDIEAGLSKAKTITEIAKSLDKEYNTIKYEIIKHRQKKYPSTFNGEKNLCLYFKNKSCTITGLCNVDNCNQLCKTCHRHFCNNICNRYVEYICGYLTNKPYCCNGCDNIKGCRDIKMIYYARYADIEYHNELANARSGNRLSQEEINYANTEIKDRIKQGQSLDVIVKTDDNIKKCTSSYYNYTNQGLFEFSNIDLRRKVSYKAREKKKDKNAEENKKLTETDKLKATRNYDCFTEFVNKYPSYNIAEMDTVIGKRDEKEVLFTLLFRKSNFMIAFLVNNKEAETITQKINELKEKITNNLFFCLFRILLTDNGVEFTLIEQIEKLENDKKINLFFCDPGKSNQKGKIEKNHVELRKIIPKGTSIKQFTQNDINLAMSHINSYPRKLLNYKTPYDILKENLGEQNFNHLIGILDYKIIEPKEIVLSPKLLKEKKKK